jgi:phosphatidate cytidylyltransferase
MIAPLFAVTLPGFAIGALFMALANRRVTAPVARGRWLKLGVFFLIVHVVLGVALAGPPWVALLVLLMLLAGAIELRHAWCGMQQPRPRRVWTGFIMVATASLIATWLLPPAVFALLFLITAASDGFAQVVGQLFGRTPLAPRISPAKTVEGLAGGLIAAIVVAALASGILLPQWSLLQYSMLALATGFAGLTGDLSASWVKRRAGIKDYSAALPGQGGFLDRFDSLLGALTLVGPALLLLAPAALS